MYEKADALRGVGFFGKRYVTLIFDGTLVGPYIRNKGLNIILRLFLSHLDIELQYPGYRAGYAGLNLFQEPADL